VFSEKDFQYWKGASNTYRRRQRCDDPRRRRRRAGRRPGGDAGGRLSAELVWEWHELIGSPAAGGYRVLCPDLRGAGWSSAPDDRYFKPIWPKSWPPWWTSGGGVGPVRLVGHDWGPPAYIMMLRHPQKVTAPITVCAQLRR
jgi:pimeloyl-ACP methyl ester carboxylesterase